MYITEVAIEHVRACSGPLYQNTLSEDVYVSHLESLWLGIVLFS
jgi:hypothetical protein